jgi:hypothetical protein
MNIHRATLMPRRKQDTAVTTVVLNIFEGIHHVRDEAEAKGAAKGDACPDAVERIKHMSACF